MIRPLLLLALALAAAPLSAQRPRARPDSPPPTPLVLPDYADHAALVLAAPVIADATIRAAAQLKPAEAPGLPAGFARFYVTADIAALIRGPDGLPARITYLADVPLDARGKPPKLGKRRVLLFGRTLAGRAAMLQLVARDGQRWWTPGADARVRGIVREVVAADAPPEITGVGRAFHVAGTLPGEGETQVFLPTVDGRPVSLSVLTRPESGRAWSVALSEIVDEAAAPPARDTLLWYRLACSLPRRLPDASVAGADPADAEAARADYAFVIASLGPCAGPVSGGGGPG